MKSFQLRCFEVVTKPTLVVLQQLDQRQKDQKEAKGKAYAASPRLQDALTMSNDMAMDPTQGVLLPYS